MAGTYRYRIEPRDIDSTLRARIYAICDHILQAANDDADLLGFGVRDLNAGNASWVLSRMAFEMERRPSRHEEIDVYTWVNDYGRLMTTRNMIVSDTGGHRIGAAVTQWAMIDLDTRRPLDLSALANRKSAVVERESPIEKPHKIGPFECDVERPHKVVYSDIDFNGHVNSMKYLEWMTDTLPPEIAERSDAFRFDINYIHEAKLGQSLRVCYACMDCVHMFDIRNTDGLSVCKASVKF